MPPGHAEAAHHEAAHHVPVAQHAMARLVPRWGVRAEAGSERRCLAILERAQTHDAQVLEVLDVRLRGGAGSCVEEAEHGGGLT